MPSYEFICKECKKTFGRIMTLAEYEKGGITCPHCKSKKLEQKAAASDACSPRPAVRARPRDGGKAWRESSRLPAARPPPQNLIQPAHDL